MMVLGTGADQSTEPKSQLRPSVLKRFHWVPSVVQPAVPSREKLAIRPGEFWSALVAQPVSSRPEIASPSIRCQFFPRSELRQRPRPTTLMVTSALVRFTTTPEQPPGQGAFAPLLVNRSSNELEMSVQVSAACAECAATRAVENKISAATCRDARKMKRI